MKKLMLILMCTALLFSAPFSASAAEDDSVIVHDLEKNQRIDYLFSLRTKLEVNYEENIAEIQQIDQELQEYGVYSISQGELLYKLGYDAMPAVEIESSDTINWTSRRVIVTYHGQHYELQIIEGIPSSGTSALRRNNVVMQNDATGFVAGSLNCLTVIAETAIGEIPVVGEGVTFFSTFGDVLRGYDESCDENSVIDYADSTALVSLTTHMKYIFVKGYGSGDNYQILCYTGSSVEYLITSVTAVDFLVDGTLYTEHDINSFEGTVYSDYFNDYTIATKNYSEFRNGVNTDFTYEYTIRRFNIEILGGSTSLLAPMAYAPIQRT